MTRSIRSLLPLALAAFLVPTPPAAAARKAGKPRPRGPQLVTLPTSSPVVALRIAFRTGSVDDPSGQEGLAALTAEVVGQGGTRDLAYAEVIEKLYPMAARLSVRADKELTVLAGEVHRDHLEAFWSVARDLVCTPRFDPADLARVKTDAENSIVNGLRGSDDEELGKRVLQAELYQGHPYAHPEVGTVEGLRHIRMEDVQGFYRTHFTLDRLLVGVGGGYPKGFPERVMKELRALPAKGAAPREVPPNPAIAGRRVTLVQKEALADALSWGFPLALTRAHNDFFPLMVANSYLGEHRTFSGVLMNELREARGLNYGDYSYIENFIQDGWGTFVLPNIPRSQQFFSVWLRPVKPENTGFALRASLYHVEKLVRDGIPEDGFETTRDFLLGYSRLWAQSTARRLGFKMDSVWYGRKDFLAEIQDRLPKLTRDAVNGAVRRHLSSDALRLAIITGQAEKLKAALGSGAATPIKYDTAGTPQAVIDADRVIESWPLRLSADDIRIVPAGEVFER